ncbi:hypothetical protein KAR91_26155 [Candidatus Pacearchaeota archaeon]|nr:hypothetical protein [Candidatus Pacearchaeota archaeon]
MTKLKRWTSENKIAVAGMLVIIVLCLGGGIGSHLLAFGGVKSDVITLKKVADKHEGKIDAQTIIVTSIETKVDLMLEAWGIEKPKKVKQ